MGKHWSERKTTANKPICKNHRYTCTIYPIYRV